MKTALLAGTAASAALCLAPLSALALTPQEAWENWKAQATEAGVAVATAGESMSGGALVVTGVAFVHEEEGNAVSGTIDEIRFADAGGGRVTVTMSEAIPLSMSGTDEEGKDYAAEATLRAPGLVYTVTDGPSGGTDAAYEAPEVSVTLDSFAQDGEPVNVAMTIVATALSGAYVVSGDETMALQNTLALGTLAMDVNGSDPEEGDIAVTLSMADIESVSSSVGLSLFDMADQMAALSESGNFSEARGSAGATEITVAVRNAPETTDLRISMDGGAGAARLDADRVEYDVAYEGLSFAVSGSEIPFPQVTGSLGQWQTKVSAPTSSSDETAPAALLFALRDLTLGEEIWGLFDPAGALPRDPATLILDIAGQMRLLQDVFSGEFAESADMPAEVENLSLNELRLSLAGAELTGEGAMAFDYDAPGPFGPGSPAPDGTVNLTLRGGQTLLDTLVSMGLVPQENAMMVRMMTGMLARPGDGPDTLVSEITVMPDGTILANGAPLPF